MKFFRGIVLAAAILVCGANGYAQSLPPSASFGASGPTGAGNDTTAYHPTTPQNGTLSLGNGGTGSTTASGARSNLGAPAAQTCTNQALTAVDAAGTAGNCKTLTSAYVDSSLLKSANNLSDVGSAATSRSNLGVRYPINFNGAASLLTNGTNFIGAANYSSGEGNVQFPVAGAGTVTDIACGTTASGAGGYVTPGTGITVTYTLRKNEADTAVTCNHTSSGSCTATGFSVAIAAGDRIAVKTVTSGVPNSVFARCGVLVLP